MAAMGGPVFAFAKPVPYDPRRLRHPGKDDALVALAGPVSNILQALLGTALVYAVWNLGYGAVVAGNVPYEALFWAMRVCTTYVYVNLTLAFFNLIPLPPLDGSKLLLPLLRGKAKMEYYRIQHYAMPILLILLYVLPEFLGVDPLGAFLDLTAGNLYGPSALGGVAHVVQGEDPVLLRPLRPAPAARDQAEGHHRLNLHLGSRQPVPSRGRAHGGSGP